MVDLIPTNELLLNQANIDGKNINIFKNEHHAI